ncbi:SDR family NAD(P)-dependent oxidoreductase [uncultured Vibrio sp.]|uniref:SDR family NAD(P)-dependent oxidoreductase n=1 Tax=uncultured Vibrio sp. TaxID=114054 RepID=UPI000919F6DB|nr:SDR family NAD(P)-dependent oxidoreductase [uncultured Vibrio sp.]OIQ25881.1 MAG: short-chain dehydrogenase [Vibrio sp. MedPE-SWchi]
MDAPEGNTTIKNIAIIGSSGAIGSALTQQLSVEHPHAHIHAFSRSGTTFNDSLHTQPQSSNISYHGIDYRDKSIEEAASIASEMLKLDMVLVTTGILHGDNLKPEKSLKDLSARQFQHIFEVNTITPALVAKHFIPQLNKEQPSYLAALSARVGSISDNHSGGWYAYRASKAALNMILKTASIEAKRTHPNSIVVGLHPGTVDSALSKPFQRNVPKEKLFSADYSARCLLKVLDSLSPQQSGKIFAWDGTEIAP